MATFDQNHYLSIVPYLFCARDAFLPAIKDGGVSSDQFMKITGKGISYLDSSYSKTYFGLIKLLKQYRWEFQFLVPDANAAYLGCGYSNLDPFHKYAKNIGVFLINKASIFWLFSKGFIVIVEKRIKSK